MKKIFLIASFIGLALQSCTSYVENMNVDPDLLTDADTRTTIQGVMLHNQWSQTSNATRTVMLWLSQAEGVDRQYITLNNWNNTVAADYDNTFNQFYKTLTQTRYSQSLADKEQNFKIKGILQILEAHNVGTLTSLFGDIPYSEFKFDGTNRTPKYDKQVDVYNKLQILLDEAIVNLTKSGSLPIAATDIHYGFDLTKWGKLAYGLKARYYLHVKDYQKAYNNSLLSFTSTTDDMNTKFGTVAAQNMSPFFDFLVRQRPGYMEGTGHAMNLLSAGNPDYRGNTKTNETARYNYNYTSSGELNTNSGAKFGSATAFALVSYGEMLLIQTEYHLRQSTPDINAALTSYNTYRALLQAGSYVSSTGTRLYSAYVAADFAAGGIENTDNINNIDAFLRELYEERYVFFIGNYEAFTDYRRTNNIAKIKLRNFQNTPQRLLYSQLEINANAANMPSPLPTVSTKTQVH